MVLKKKILRRKKPVRSSFPTKYILIALLLFVALILSISYITGKIEVSQTSRAEDLNLAENQNCNKTGGSEDYCKGVFSCKEGFSYDKDGTQCGSTIFGPKYCCRKLPLSTCPIEVYDDKLKRYSTKNLEENSCIFRKIHKDYLICKRDEFGKLTPVNPKNPGTECKSFLEEPYKCDIAQVGIVPISPIPLYYKNPYAGGLGDCVININSVKQINKYYCDYDPILGFQIKVSPLGTYSQPAPVGCHVVKE